MPVGSGSGFQNSDLLDPAENGPDPQPWFLLVIFVMVSVIACCTCKVARLVFVGGGAPEVQPQAGHENKENFCGRTLGHHQPGGHQGVLRAVQRSQGVYAGL